MTGRSGQLPPATAAGSACGASIATAASRSQAEPMRSGGINPLSHAAWLSWMHIGTGTTAPQPGSAGGRPYSDRAVFDLSALSAPAPGVTVGVVHRADPASGTPSATKSKPR